MPRKAHECSKCYAKFFRDLEVDCSVDEVAANCPYCGATEVEDAGLDSRDVLMLMDIKALFPASLDTARG
jgi:hypothetical protein